MHLAERQPHLRIMRGDIPPMECAALFVIATLRGVRAGAVLAVNAHPESLRARLAGAAVPVVAEASEAISTLAVERMIDVALHAAVSLARRHGEREPYA